jgi:hypothetical protein
MRFILAVKIKFISIRIFEKKKIEKKGKKWKILQLK